VRTILPGTGNPPETWRRLIIDRPERLLCAILRVDEPTPRYLGFAARQEGWALQVQEPVFAVMDDETALFADLTEDNSQDAARTGWRDWGQTRGLAAADLDACTLEVNGARLRIHVPDANHDRWRKVRADVLKVDVWLLAGEAALRRAFVLDFAS
jgi:hypothetical protein